MLYVCVDCWHDSLPAARLHVALHFSFDLRTRNWFLFALLNRLHADSDFIYPTVLKLWTFFGYLVSAVRKFQFPFLSLSLREWRNCLPSSFWQDSVSYLSLLLKFASRVLLNNKRWFQFTFSPNLVTGCVEVRAQASCHLRELDLCAATLLVFTQSPSGKSTRVLMIRRPVSYVRRTLASVTRLSTTSLQKYLFSSLCVWMRCLSGSDYPILPTDVIFERQENMIHVQLPEWFHACESYSHHDLRTEIRPQQFLTGLITASRMTAFSCRSEMKRHQL